MLIVIWPLLVALVGAFLYFSVSNPKWQKIGVILFAVGVYWTVGMLTGQHFTIGGAHG